VARRRRGPADAAEDELGRTTADIDDQVGGGTDRSPASSAVAPV